MKFVIDSDGVLRDVIGLSVTDKILVIPDNVVEIADDLFFERKDFHIKRVEFNKGLKRIGTRAFTGQKTLLQIYIPPTVEEIGDYAFASSGLQLFDLGCGEQEIAIGAGAFGDTSMMSVSIRCKKVKLARDAFSCNLKLKHVKIIGDVEWGERIFSTCWDLAHVELDEARVDNIPSWFLYDSKGLVSVTFPPGIKSIGDSAFECSGLTEISIEPTVEQIGERAFSKSHLKSIDFSQSVNLTEIGKMAFEDCYIKNIDLKNTSVSNDCDNSYLGCRCTNIIKSFYANK